MAKCVGLDCSSLYTVHLANDAKRMGGKMTPQDLVVVDVDGKMMEDKDLVIRQEFFNHLPTNAEEFLAGGKPVWPGPTGWLPEELRDGPTGWLSKELRDGVTGNNSRKRKQRKECCVEEGDNGEKPKKQQKKEEEKQRKEMEKQKKKEEEKQRKEAEKQMKKQQKQQQQQQQQTSEVEKRKQKRKEIFAAVDGKVAAEVKRNARSTPESSMCNVSTPGAPKRKHVSRKIVSADSNLSIAFNSGRKNAVVPNALLKKLDVTFSFLDGDLSGCDFNSSGELNGVDLLSEPAAATAVSEKQTGSGIVPVVALDLGAIFEETVNGVNELETLLNETRNKSLFDDSQQ
jgi:hypothetical protein